MPDANRRREDRRLAQLLDRIDPPDGRPHVMPVWGVWFGGQLLFSTDRTFRKGRNKRSFDN